MIKRTYHTNKLLKVMEPMKDELIGFEESDWMKHKENVCLQTEDGLNFALFERHESLSTVVFGHYFLTARGKEALAVCKGFLREIFTGPYNIEIIQGITPCRKRGALWMNKQLKFASQGILETTAGRCELVALTKHDWMNNK
jgi:hypothetical protein